MDLESNARSIASSGSGLSAPADFDDPMNDNMREDWRTYKVRGRGGGVWGGGGGGVGKGVAHLSRALRKIGLP